MRNTRRSCGDLRYSRSRDRHCGLRGLHSKNKRNLSTFRPIVINMPKSRIKKKQSKFLSVHSCTALVLRELVETFDLLATANQRMRVFNRYGFGAFEEIRSARDRADRRRAFLRLEKQNLIRVQKQANRYALSLTDEGARQYIRMHMMHADLLPDGEVCMVVFDIPESQRRLRSLLRYFLSDFGFLPIQKSVWIGRFDHAKSISELFHLHQAEGWIRSFTCREER